MPDPVVPRDGDADPNVVLPRHVREAAANVDLIHAAAYADPQPEPQPQPQPQPGPDGTIQPDPQPQPQPQPDPQPQPEDSFNAPATPTDIQNDVWASRYNSMRGRFEQSQRVIESMQTQMQELGDELLRTQALISRAPAPGTTTAQDATYLTPEDEQNYGTELLDLAQRAAKQAVGPELDSLKKQNATLEQELRGEKQGKVYAALDAAVPNWRVINKSQPFLRWLALRDVYSGTVRKGMLQKAMSEADPHRVVSFFKGFLTEAQATGHDFPGTDQQPAPQPRQAAVPLETLAAPGRVRTAGGDPPPTPDNTSFTRAQVSQFYRDVNAGRYATRQDEKNRIEQQIFAAQNGGRIR